MERTLRLLAGLRTGCIPTLHGSRYFLLESPHHVAPPQFAESVFTLQVVGYVPIITHPERLTWISHHYETFCSLTRSSVWLQVTAGSLTGRFGKAARYWGERLLDEGLVHTGLQNHTPATEIPDRHGSFFKRWLRRVAG